MNRMNEMVLLRPWAMKQDTLFMMAQIFERHLRGEKLSSDEIYARIGHERIETPDYQVTNGIAHIPIYGVIAKRSSMVNNISQPKGTSTEEIKRDLAQALDDPNVQKILLDVDSPGGSVSGIAELSDFIFYARGKKPITAFANGQMDSAAYWIGSAADKIYATKSTEVGSIGVYTILRDFSVMEHNAGIKTQIIKAGRFKAAGDPSKPLTEDERNVIQEEINAYYDLFVDAVGRNRSMSREDVLGIADGKVFIGQHAFDAGLVDGIRTFESFFEEPQKSLVQKSKASADSLSVQINKNNDKEGQNMDVTIEKLKSDYKPLTETLIFEGKVIGLEEGKKIGIEEGKKISDASTKSAEKARIAGIIEAMPPGAEKLALEAIKNDLSVEAAKDKFLQAIKKDTNPSLGQVENLNVKTTIDEKDVDGKKHLERAQAYQREHSCSMTEALQKTASSRERK